MMPPKTAATITRKTAFVHDNFVQGGGGERVAEALVRCLPDADMFSSVVVDTRLTPYIRGRHIETTWMQHLPAIGRFYRHYFLLYPFAMRGLNVSSYDVIVSNCYGMAKMVRKRTGALHICYCHSPTRWIWRIDDYLERETMSPQIKRLLRFLTGRLAKLDFSAAQDVDHFITNSKVVAERIKKFYRRPAIVINPPIQPARFSISQEIEDYYLVTSRLAAYKRIDLAIIACEQLGRKLKIIGEGPDRQRLQKLAGPCTDFLGRLPDVQVAEHMSRCRALLFTGEEDFGMAPLEVNAAGRPCIAFAKGGALETITPGVNGLFFEKATVESLAAAIECSETTSWNATAMRSHAESFNEESFQSHFKNLITELSEAHFSPRSDREVLNA